MVVLVPVASDYAQLAINAACLMVGIPLNLATFFQLCSQYGKSRNRIHLIYLNLNISDLLVLIFYSLIRLWWLIIYEWLAGDLACRLLKFFESLSFVISSYVMVCIAIDRLYCLHRPLHANSHSRVAKMLAIAWILAALVAAPQFLVWQEHQPLSFEGNFSQCANIWNVQKDLNQSGEELFQWRAYSIYHVSTVFWIPLIVLLICYALIIKAIVDVAGSIHQNTRGSKNKRFERRRADESEGLCRVSGQARLQRAKMRALKITLTLVTIYILCWLPYNTLSWWHIINPEGYEQYEDSFYFLHGLVVLNSVLNPMIYGRLQACVECR